MSVRIQTQQTDILTRQPAKKPRPKLTFPSIFGKKSLARDHYFTAGSLINEGNRRDVHQEPSPFKYPDDLEQFSSRVTGKLWRKAKKKATGELKYNKHHNYQSRQKIDLLNRLWVKNPKMKNIETVLDVDPHFFSLIEGRPVSQKLIHKEYIRDVRDVLRAKITIGFKEHVMLSIDQEMNFEQKTIRQTREEFEQHVDTFENFLFADHTTSMALLGRAEEEEKVTLEKLEQYTEILLKCNSLKASLYGLEENWRTCKMYQKFLYVVSPMTWRKTHDFCNIELKESVEDFNPAAKVKSLSSTSDSQPSTEANSLTTLIDNFLEDIQYQDEPKLYFEEPQELISVLGFMEIQNLHSMLHLEELAIPLEKVNSAVSKLKSTFDDDIAYLIETIGHLEEGIAWEEKWGTYLEQLGLELINEDFQELVSNDRAVNMYVFVEDVYENRVGCNDSNLSMLGMMQVIEAKYLQTCLDFDRLPSDIVCSAEMHGYGEQLTIMKDAKEAAKKLVQAERLVKNLVRIMEPPVCKKTRELKWRSAPKVGPKKPPPPSPPTKTEEEYDHLAYFLDFCEHTDDADDFGIRIHKVSKKNK